MLQPLDGPSDQGKLSVTDAAVTEVKISASVLSERKVVTLQPTDGKVRVYFGDGSGAPLLSTVASDGFLVFKNQITSFEAAESQSVYVCAESGTVQVVVAERA